MSSTSGAIAGDKAFKDKERGDEERYVRAKEQAQLAALKEQQQQTGQEHNAQQSRRDEIEGGFGGQEDLEDRYATTSGEH